MNNNAAAPLFKNTRFAVWFAWPSKSYGSGGQKRWVASTCEEYPLYRRSWFADGVRKFGKLLRHCVLADAWLADDSASFHDFDPSDELFVLASRALDDFRD
jgi:hypothetical protein